LAALHAFQPAPDTGDGFRPVQRVQQLLLRARVLHDDGWLSVHGEHFGLAGFLEPLEVPASVLLELR